MKRLGTDSHTCLVYSTNQEKWEVVMPYLEAGLAEKEKVVYISQDHRKHLVEKAMMERDEEVFGKAIADGSVSILSCSQTYCRGNRFDPIGMLRLIEDLAKQALKAGYARLRVCGQMTWWTMEYLPGSEQIVKYERMLSDFTQDHKVSVMCLYDERKFSPDMIKMMQRMHAGY